VNIFVAILGLGFLVLIHEAGHFFTARAVGMSPRKFYVGFPPALAKVRRGGIEYGLGAIPLGGYVKIPGMHRPAPSDLDMYYGAALAEAPHLLAPVERIKQALADGDMAGARVLLPELERSIDATTLSPRAERAARRGFRELGDGLGGDAYWRQRTWRKIAVIFAGPGANLILAVVLFAVLLMAGTGGYRLGFELRASGDRVLPVIEDVREDAPADRMGLRPGDQIVAMNGRPVEAEQISERIRGSGGNPISVTVVRDGRRLVLGPTRPDRFESLGPTESVWESLKLTGIITREIGKSLLRLVRGEGRDEISSPVGIVDQSSDAVERGADTYLWVLGLLSLSLALLNLLPLLPLDGGHIAFSIVEGVRGRSVGREIYERVSAVGIALVLLLFFVGLSNDVGRIND
jgi:regulator of sigma E protease